MNDSKRSRNGHARPYVVRILTSEVEHSPEKLAQIDRDVKAWHKAGSHAFLDGSGGSGRWGNGARLRYDPPTSGGAWRGRCDVVLVVDGADVERYRDVRLGVEAWARLVVGRVRAGLGGRRGGA